MKEKYKVSLVIPVYNVEKFIEDSLHSALNQDFQSIEYIIVDDASCDKSMMLAEEVIAVSNRKEDIVVYRKTSNEGLSEARNTGMDLAHGEYIFFLDSDDILPSSCISSHYNKIVATGADFTVANVRQEGAKSIHIRPIMLNIAEKLPLTSFYDRDWSTSAWNKMYRRDFLKTHHLRFQKGILHEDYLWMFNVAKVATKCVSVRKYTYIYKIRKGSITTSMNSDLKIHSMIEILKTIRSDVSSNSVSGEEFLSFVKFNTALYILNYKGRTTRAKYYRELQKVRSTPPDLVSL